MTSTNQPGHLIYQNWAYPLQAEPDPGVVRTLWFYQDPPPVWRKRSPNEWAGMSVLEIHEIIPPIILPDIMPIQHQMPRTEPSILDYFTPPVLPPDQTPNEIYRGGDFGVSRPRFRALVPVSSKFRKFGTQ